MPTEKTTDSRPFATNWNQFFKEEKDIWLQNLSNRQISMQFQTTGGVEPFLIPAMKDPINITQFIPFQSVKESTDFRKLIARRPPVLTVLKEEEVQAFYARKAKTLGLVDSKGRPDVDQAIADAEARAHAIRNRQPLPDAPIPRKVTEDPDTGTEEIGTKEVDIISSRVLHIMAQVSNPHLTDKDRATAQQVLGELMNLSDLSMDDFIYIEANGHYKTVQKWAREEMKRLVAAKVAE